MTPSPTWRKALTLLPALLVVAALQAAAAPPAPDDRLVRARALAEALREKTGSPGLSVFLKPETRALLFTSQKTAAGEETGVGLGWRIGADTAGRRIFHHGGMIEGGRAFLMAYPDRKVTVALLANLSRASFAEAEAQSFAELFLE